jgi:hypothetical protein
MIGKAEWFCPRKFGWGLGVKKIEGFIYVVAIIVLATLVGFLPIAQEYRLGIIAALIAFVLIDVLHIMTKVYAKLDEREQAHQAMAERNAAFVAVVGLVAYAGYISLTSMGSATLDPMLVVPIAILLLMSLAKGATLIYLERKG